MAKKKASEVENVEQVQNAGASKPQQPEAPAAEVTSPEQLEKASTSLNEPLYDVVINNGNAGGASIASLTELGRLAAEQLVVGREREVTLRIRARMVQGAYGAKRADGVK